MKSKIYVQLLEFFNLTILKKIIVLFSTINELVYLTNQYYRFDIKSITTNVLLKIN